MLNKDIKKIRFKTDTAVNNFTEEQLASYTGFTVMTI